MFGKALKAVMEDRGLSRKQIAQVIGASQASISQWITGKAVPRPERQRFIAQRLGLPEDYFEETSEDPGIRDVSVEVVARLMHVNPVTIRKGLQQRVFPWGYAVKTSDNRWCYIINAARFEQIEGVGIAIKAEGN